MQQNIFLQDQNIWSKKGNHDTIGDQSDERAVQSLMFPPEWDRKSLWTWLLPPFNQSHIKRCEDDQTNLDQFKTFSKPLGTLVINLIGKSMI